MTAAQAIKHLRALRLHLRTTGLRNVTLSKYELESLAAVFDNPLVELAALGDAVAPPGPESGGSVRG